WVTQVQGYLTLNSHVYETNHQKIAFALMFMTKGATSLFVENYENESNIGRHIQFSNIFKCFVKRLKATFKSGDQTTLAILKLSSVTQGRWEFEAYIVEFMGLINKASLHEESWEGGIFFSKGLAPDYHNWILNTRRTPSTVKEWIIAMGEAHVAITTRWILEGKDSDQDHPCFISYCTPNCDPDAMDINQ
ncbi:hypothetical protein M404DRAFT_150389, partial [Pisolithus tinctorius Marx 270]